MLSIFLLLVVVVASAKAEISCVDSGYGPCNDDYSCPNSNATCIASKKICCPDNKITGAGGGGGGGGGGGSGGGSNPTCCDKVGPNGVSDCPSRANLCNNAIYYDLMTQQCPRTCNRCSSSSSSSGGGGGGGGVSTCMDKGTDCPSRAYLCSDSIYYDLMTQQCPRTCNRC